MNVVVIKQWNMDFLKFLFTSNSDSEIRGRSGQYSELQLLISVSTTLNQVTTVNGNASTVEAEWLGFFNFLLNSVFQSFKQLVCC